MTTLFVTTTRAPREILWGQARSAPHISLHIATHARTEHPDLEAALLFAGEDGRHEHVICPAATPHVVMDSWRKGDLVFENENVARAFVDNANAHTCSERYSYLFTGPRPHDPVGRPDDAGETGHGGNPG